jgi:hypothetical protein
MEESIDLFLVKHGDQLQDLYNNINNYILDNQFNILDGNLRCNRELKLSDFFDIISHSIHFEETIESDSEENNNEYYMDEY